VRQVGAAPCSYWVTCVFSLWWYTSTAPILVYHHSCTTHDVIAAHHIFKDTEGYKGRSSTKWVRYCSGCPLRIPTIPRSRLIHFLSRPKHDTLNEWLTLVVDLSMTVAEVEDLIQQIQSPPTQNASMPLTQSAAVIMKSTRTFSTHWEPLDKLLGGGLVQGHVLELSGPPGCPKENIAIDIVSSFLESGEEVIFVGSHRFSRPVSGCVRSDSCALDCQNMTSLETLRGKFSGQCS